MTVSKDKNPKKGSVEIQWRKQIEVDWNVAEIKNCTDFWIQVLNYEDAGGNHVFQDLADFAITLLSLPSSNAVANELETGVEALMDYDAIIFCCSVFVCLWYLFLYERCKKKEVPSSIPQQSTWPEEKICSERNGVHRERPSNDKLASKHPCNNDAMGNDLTRAIEEELSENGLLLSNYRGQSDDNGANMKSKKQDVQIQIMQKNLRAFYLPCASHSLNLVRYWVPERQSRSNEMERQERNLSSFFDTWRGNSKLTKKRGETISKPKLVHEYNDTMGGVDKVDQHLADYTLPRKRGKKFYKKIFFHLFDLALWNSFVLYSKTGGTKTTLEYRMDVVKLIIENLKAASEPPTNKRKTKTEDTSSYEEIGNELRKITDEPEDLWETFSKNISPSREVAVIPDPSCVPYVRVKVNCSKYRLRLGYQLSSNSVPYRVLEK
ncbi:hypothetical protein ILUMI_10723 [Ignelater luminosus]|uniref:PiggyBac transposable element-derived protein domain-containing protein n=1 Tax=Ignelater luminosus TaxID=2038154 RepID=A0A8K0D1K3_IGNLU|nr:hypothetical protein ILUMI_10723 [Ignelater luminosus]